MKMMPMMICSAALAAGAAAPARAQMIVDVSKVTCAQFLTASPNAVEVGIWLSGYYNGLKKNTQLDLNQFKKSADAVVAECRADQKQTVMQVTERLLSQQK